MLSERELMITARKVSSVFSGFLGRGPGITPDPFNPKKPNENNLPFKGAGAGVSLAARLSEAQMFENNFRHGGRYAKTNQFVERAGRLVNGLRYSRFTSLPRRSFAGGGHEKFLVMLPVRAWRQAGIWG